MKMKRAVICLKYAPPGKLGRKRSVVALAPGIERIFVLQLASTIKMKMELFRQDVAFRPGGVCVGDYGGGALYQVVYVAMFCQV